MAWEKPHFLIPLPVASDLSASQFCAVDCNSSGQAVLPSNSGRAIGVMQNKPAAAGQVADVMCEGVTKMVCGAGVTRGGNVAVDAAGKAKNAATGNIILGVALETGANGRIIPVLLMPQGVSA